ncbi:pH regulation protein F [Candidatus Marinamargulisbacteria bacterium SCGC AG-343-K17]|nr:pH regulation protein F [Candidatus Marinamargulisbacteria bacterium SCGC AG-343-K17]
MDKLFLYSSLIMIALMIMLVYRIIVGPTVIDRIVAVNVIGTKSIVLLVLMGVIFGRTGMFVDIAIGYGLLNFIASLAAAKYFKKHRKLHVTDDISQSHDSQYKKEELENVN